MACHQNSNENNNGRQHNHFCFVRFQSNVRNLLVKTTMFAKLVPRAKTWSPCTVLLWKKRRRQRSGTWDKGSGLPPPRSAPYTSPCGSAVSVCKMIPKPLFHTVGKADPFRKAKWQIFKGLRSVSCTNKCTCVYST